MPSASVSPHLGSPGPLDKFGRLPGQDFGRKPSSSERCAGCGIDRDDRPKTAWRSSASAGLCLIICDDRAAQATARIVIFCQACGTLSSRTGVAAAVTTGRALLPERVILSALKRTGDQWQPLERSNKGGGSAPTPRWMPATGLWMTAPMTLTAQFAANSIKNDPTSTARLYAGSKKTWRIYWVKTLSHHMR